MKTLRPGEIATELLRTGRQLTVSVSGGSAIVERFYGGELVDTVSVTSTSDFGPYLNDYLVRVTCIAGFVKTSESVSKKRVVSSNVSKIVPSSYVGVKTATTSAAGQSEAIASEAEFIFVRNLDASNDVKIAFGANMADSISAHALSNDIAKPFIEFNFPVPAGMKYFSWIGVGGTVNAVIGQGV